MLKNIIILFLILNSSLFANITYPYSIKYFDSFEGGKLFLSNPQNTATNEPQFYLVKTNWMLNDGTVYSWNGFNRNNAKGENIGNAVIVDAIYFQNKLFLLLRENNNFAITTFDSVFSPTVKIVLDSNEFLTNIIFQQTHSLKNIRFISNPNSDKLFLLNNEKLYDVGAYAIRPEKVGVCNTPLQLIAENVIDCKFFMNSVHYEIAYLVDKREYGLIYFLDKQSNSHYAARVPMTDKTSIFPLQNFLITANSTNNLTDALLSVIDISSKNILASEWLKVNQNLLDSDNFSDNIFALTSEKNNYKLTKIPALSLHNEREWQTVKLPENLCTPIKLAAIDNFIYIFFSNALVVFDNELNEIIFDIFDFSNFSGDDLEIFKYENYLILSSTNGSLILQKDANPLWFFNRQIYNSYRFALPIIFFLIAFFIYRNYRNQKRLFDAVIELPSFGFVFFINRVGKLVKLNEGGKQILDISDNIPLGKQISYYCKTEMTKPIVEIVERGLVSRLSFQQKINIIDGNIPREWLCSLMPLRNVAGRFSGIILTGVDITEELERRMLTNWSQLAHDMQTNLSTIRLNAEQMNINSDDDLKIKNKIIQQVMILIQRVRDVVTVGRDDKLETSTVNSIDFCNEIRSEFDDNVFSLIQFVMNLKDFNFICDKPKLLRAVRNAVENGIKAMKNKEGTITISCNKDIHHITISVKDTGVGMDENIKNKIFTPFYSTARKEGGYGIGTMIMQRVAELHGGKLLIESKLNVGTEIIFQIPDLARRKNNE